MTCSNKLRHHKTVLPSGSHLLFSINFKSIDTCRLVETFSNRSFLWLSRRLSSILSRRWSFHWWIQSSHRRAFHRSGRGCLLLHSLHRTGTCWFLLHRLHRSGTGWFHRWFLLWLGRGSIIIRQCINWPKHACQKSMQATHSKSYELRDCNATKFITTSIAETSTPHTTPCRRNA